MTTKTFIVNNLFNEFTLYHPEIPLTAIAGHPDVGRIGAAWVLWNGSTDNIIHVKNIKVTNQMTQATALNTSTLNIDFISAYTSSDWTTDVLNITKLDSTNTNIPSQVKILSRVASVTSSSTIRRFMNMQQLNMTRANALLCSKRVGSMAGGFNTATVQACGYGNSTVQGFILNEGEGIALNPGEVQSNVGYRMTILFDIGGDTYVAGETIRPMGLMVPMILYNGSGSGVVVKVLQMECREIGTDELCNFAIQKLDGVQNLIYSTDVTSTVLPTDSANILPTGIKMYEDCIVNLYGSKFGAIITNPSYIRNTQQYRGIGPGLAGVRMAGIVASSELINEVSSPIMIRPGEGLALFQKNSSGIGRYGASVLFNTEAIASGTAGPVAMSFVC